MLHNTLKANGTTTTAVKNDNINERVNGGKMLGQVGLNVKAQIETALNMANKVREEVNKTDGRTVNLVREFLPLVRAIDYKYIVERMDEKNMIKVSRATINLAYKTADKMDDYGLTMVPNVATMATLRKVLSALDTIKANKPQMLEGVLRVINSVFEKYDDEKTANIAQRAEFEKETFKVINSRIKKIKAGKKEEKEEKPFITINKDEVNDIPVMVARVKQMIEATGKAELFKHELEAMLKAMDKKAA